MAIEALYPSRRQSQRRNPLFARERRQRRLAVLLILGASLLCLEGLRSGPAGAADDTGASAAASDRGSLATPFALRRMFGHEPPASGRSNPRPQKPIRVIPLFNVSVDAAVVASPYQRRDG